MFTEEVLAPIIMFHRLSQIRSVKFHANLQA
jgi:hypothetical protein